MARVTTEERFWNDPRFEALIRISKTGMGDCFLEIHKVWRLGQGYWKKDCSLIPEKTFRLFALAQHLIDVDLVEVRPEGVYCRGATDLWKFLNTKQKSESGKLGGQLSAQRERDDKGRLLPKKGEKVQAESKQVLGQTQAPIQAQGSTKSKHSKLSYSSSCSLSKDKEEIHTSTGVDRPGWFLKIWNEHRGPLPECKVLNAHRRKQANARWKAKPDEQFWISLVREISQDDWSTGKTSGGWRADIDFFLRESTQTRGEEGYYASRKGPQPMVNPAIEELKKQHVQSQKRPEGADVDARGSSEQFFKASTWHDSIGR